MPFYKKINVLFIHIPKTGGTSIENYFYKKYSIDRTLNTLYSDMRLVLSKHSLQHSTYKELYDNKEYLNIPFGKKLKIITVVRNPYERIISDLFFFNLINKSSTPEEVTAVIKDYLYNDTSVVKYDNHPLPQTAFLINEYGTISENIHILRLENINQDMYELGFPDFNICDNVTNKFQLNYFTLLTNESIKIINKFYKKDFKMLDYRKIKIQKIKNK